MHRYHKSPQCHKYVELGEHVSSLTDILSFRQNSECLNTRRGRHGGLKVEGGLRSERSGFDQHSGHRVVSLGKIHLPPKSTGYTKEAVAPCRHD